MITKRFLVDMDGVCADVNGTLIPRLYENIPHLESEIPINQITYGNTIYTHKWFEGKVRSADVYDIMNQKGFFENLKPIDGCIEMIGHLKENGVHVEFCSTPIIYAQILHSFTEKAHWLRNHFGEWALKNVTLTSDKTTVFGKILIDDKPLVEGKEVPTWKHIVFDQPWNQGSESIRLKGWTKENMDWLIEEYHK